MLDDNFSIGGRRPTVPRKPRVSDEYRIDSNFRYLDSNSKLQQDSDAPAYGIGVESEIGRLRKVLLHTPGREIELMTPKTASELLYNDIIHYNQVRDGHSQLSGVLGLVAEVLEVEDCLRDVLDIEGVREDLLTRICTSHNCLEIYQDLLSLPSTELAKALIAGVPLRRDTMETYLSTRSFSLLPLPNMYFMRDSSFVLGNRVVTTAMASSVRLAEALIMRAIYEFHPALRGKGLLMDGCQAAMDPNFTVEGGDVLVVNRNLLLIGISQRTTARAVDSLINALVGTRAQEGNTEPFDVICVILPNERSTIHLDMVFTLVNREQAIIYAPYVIGRDRARVVRMTVSASGEKKFKELDDLLLGLRSVGVRVEPILCGGDDPLHQSREQWNSGANMFAFGPGKVLSYGMHEHTVRACENAGFRIAHAREVLKNPTVLESPRPLVVTLDGTELARGGGGPRCMTCPVLRDPI